MRKRLHNTLSINQHIYDEALKYAQQDNLTIEQYIIGKVIKDINIRKREEQGFPINRFKFIDLFAGIGGMRIAFEEVGGECVFTSEWDNYCQQTYFWNYGEIPKGDITQIEAKKIPDHDILVAGFPCQPFSIAGVSKKNSMGRVHGFLDETQGTLFFDVARIINEKRPKAFLLENVKNLKSHDNKRTYNIISNTLKELEYDIFADVIDGKYYIPQHRERIIIVGFDKKYFTKGINFDIKKFNRGDSQKPKLSLKNILDDHVDDKYTLSDKLWTYLQNYAAKHKAKGNGFGYGLVDLDGISRTLSARYYKDGSEILIPQEDKNPRRLTPQECARLQGFPYPNRFKIVVSDTQAYKQFGNSVVVPMIKAVAQEMIETIENYKKNEEKAQDNRNTI